MTTKPNPNPPRIAVDEFEVAAELGLSVFYLRKDRRTKKVIPFFRIGGSVRYNLESIRESLLAAQEGGAFKKRAAKNPGAQP